jgi:hypothetical protein
MGMLKHWSTVYYHEDRAASDRDSNYRVFRVESKKHSAVVPRSENRLFTIDYCTFCAVETYADPVEGRDRAENMPFEATLWMEGREYSTQKTAKQLAMEADAL